MYALFAMFQHKSIISSSLLFCESIICIVLKQRDVLSTRSMTAGLNNKQNNTCLRGSRLRLKSCGGNMDKGTPRLQLEQVHNYFVSFDVCCRFCSANKFVFGSTITYRNLETIFEIVYNVTKILAITE